MAIKNAIYKVDNGTDFDEIHFRTKATQVVCANGKTAEAQLEEIEKFARGFENFRLNGGDILGNIKAPDVNLEGIGAIKNIVNYLKANILDNKVSIKKTDGNGVGLFGRDNTFYILIAQDMGNPNAYLIAQALKNSGASTTHTANILNSKVLTLGAKNSIGTQVINGGNAGTISCAAIGFTWV